MNSKVAREYQVRSMEAESLSDLRGEIKTVLEVTYNRLRSAILSGIFKPGDVLRQEFIAQNLGTSRGPTREALNRLAAEGLVEFRARRGYAVTLLSRQQVKEIFDLRQLIEGQTVYWATEQRQPGDIMEVKKHLDELDSLTIASAEDLRRWSSLNAGFHDTIYACSGRPRAVQLIGSLRDSVEHYIRFEMSSRVVRNSEDRRKNFRPDHKSIFEAFRDGDPDLARKKTELHLKESEKLILTRLP